MNGKRRIAVERSPLDEGMHGNSGWQARTSWLALRAVRAKAPAVLLAAVTLTGCGNIEPWVKPYERQQIADPIMAFDANPVSKAYLDHVFEAREGARGGLGSAGGGCGCN